jgi:fructoselysine-6-P-deglycase FrlB-like protein
VSEIVHEIASQPACWAQAVDLARRVADALPAPGRRVAAIGCGTSLHVARAFAFLRESRGRGETDAFAASEFPAGRGYDGLVAITRSGTTTEVLRLLEGSDGLAPSVVVTADRGTSAVDLASTAIVLDFADERSVVQTRFPTTALALLRRHLGEDLASTIADAHRALDGPLPVEPGSFDHYVFLGHGWTVGIAEEAALKLREAAHVHSEAYPAMEYRHGPITMAGASSLVWMLGSPDPSVAGDVAATGATVRIGSLDPMAELVLVHRVAVALAEARGRDPDHPRHLTRSVMLPLGGSTRDEGPERTYVKSGEGSDDATT